MGVMKRVSLVFKAKANKALDKMEDPRETLDYSYQRQLELLTKVRQLEKGVTILGERNAREVSLEEFHVASSIRRRFKHRIDIGEDVLW